DLLALEVRDLERVPMSGRPYRLSHVPEVEAPRVVRAVLEDRERAEPAGVRSGRRPEQDPRPGPHTTSSSSSAFQRAPSTSSLACSSYTARPPRLRLLARSGSAAPRPSG